MTSAVEKDCTYSEYSLSISKSKKKQTVRAYVKTNDNTNKYVLLTLNKRNDIGDMSFSQRISLYLSEFKNFSSKIVKIKRLLSKNLQKSLVSSEIQRARCGAKSKYYKKTEKEKCSFK